MQTSESDFDMTAQVHPSADALVQTTGEEAVVLDVASEQYFGLNKVAARLWQLLDQNPSLDDAYQRLLLEYEVDPTELQRDLADIVSQLAAAGLVRIG